MGTSHSVITALQSILKQRELKVSTKTLECFVKEVDHVAPWYVCSGLLTLTSLEKLRGDLVREQQNGKLKVGPMALWKLVKSCLEDEKCRPTVIAGQGALEELQDSMSETERGERLGPLRRKGAPKKRGPSKDFGSEEVRDRGKDATGEKMKVKEKPPKGKSLYPVKELEALGLDSSDSDTGLSPSEEEDLEGAAAHYEEERYHPDERRLKKSEKKLKVTGGTGKAASRLSGPSAPPPYVENFYSDSFLSREEQKKKLHQAFPVFEGAEGRRVHAPVGYIQIKELAESVCNYGVSANFTVSQVERLATLALTPGDWQTTVKAALLNIGQYMEWKALWYDASQAQTKVNATAEGNQRN
jgi:hypothetical protein